MFVARLARLLPLRRRIPLTSLGSYLLSSPYQLVAAAPRTSNNPPFFCFAWAFPPLFPQVMSFSFSLSTFRHASRIPFLRGSLPTRCQKSPARPIFSLWRDCFTESYSFLVVRLLVGHSLTSVSVTRIVSGRFPLFAYDSFCSFAFPNCHTFPFTAIGPEIMSRANPLCTWPCAVALYGCRPPVHKCTGTIHVFFFSPLGGRTTPPNLTCLP